MNRLVNQHAAGAAHTSQHAPSLVIQPKLQVNAVGDKYEQEADAVAKEVVQKLNAPQTDAAPTHARRRTEGEESIAQRIQRQDVPEEDELQLQHQELEEEPNEDGTTVSVAGDDTAILREKIFGKTNTPTRMS